MGFIVTKIPTQREYLQDFISEYNTRRVQINVARMSLQDEFVDRLYNDENITVKDLEVLADMCTSNEGADHCVFCAAYDLLCEIEAEWAKEEENNG